MKGWLFKVILLHKIVFAFAVEQEKEEQGNLPVNKVDCIFRREVADPDKKNILEIKLIHKDISKSFPCEIRKSFPALHKIVGITTQNMRNELFPLLEQHQAEFSHIFCNLPLHVLSHQEYIEALKHLADALISNGKLYLTHDCITDQDGYAQPNVTLPDTYPSEILRGNSFPYTWETMVGSKISRIFMSDPRDLKKTLESCGICVNLYGIYEESTTLPGMINRYLGIIATK